MKKITKKQYNELYADYEALRIRILSSLILRLICRIIWGAEKYKKLLKI
jgi:hypothetical protein